MKKRNKNQTLLINKTHLIYIPLLITLSIAILVSIINAYSSYQSLVNHQKMNQLNLAQKSVTQINQTLKNKNLIMTTIEEKLIIANKIITNYDQPITNDYLKKVAQDFNLAEINYYTSDGTLIHSSTTAYLGWRAEAGDPIYEFITSTKTILHENIRQGSDTTNFYKYSNFKTPQGNVLQLGFLEQDVLNLTDQFNYESIIKNIKNNEDILYLKILDLNLNLVTTSDKSNQYNTTISTNDYKKILKGTPLIFTWYSNNTHENIIEVNVPLTINGTTQGILSVGESLKTAEKINSNASLWMLLIFAMIALFLFIIHKKFIINPMITLNNDISNLTITTNKTAYLPLSNQNVFVN